MTTTTTAAGATTEDFDSRRITTEWAAPTLTTGWAGAEGYSTVVRASTRHDQNGKRILSSLTVVDARVRDGMWSERHTLSVSHRLHHVALARYSKNALTAAHHSALTELSGLLEDRGTVGDNEWLSSVLDAITVTPVRAVSA